MKIKWLRQLKTIGLPVFVLLCVTAVIYIPKQQVADSKLKLTDFERIELENSTRNIFIQAFGVVGSIGVIWVTLRTIQQAQKTASESAEVTLKTIQQTEKTALETFKNTQEAQITERFSRAIDQLGSDKLEIRLGGIYALERISKDSDKDYWQIMEILTAYVREKAPYVREKAPVLKVEEREKVITLVSTDIQAVLTVLTRRAKTYGQGEENSLDLSKSNLQEANLQGANLQGANLQGANLHKADLHKANLQEAFLLEADLWEAFLLEADLREAFLLEADLREANLYKANLQEANLYKANLHKADLQEAFLLEADLREANLYKANLRSAKNLTPEQVKTAKNWEYAHYEEKFRAALGLPPETKE